MLNQFNSICVLSTLALFLRNYFRSPLNKDPECICVAQCNIDYILGNNLFHLRIGWWWWRWWEGETSLGQWSLTSRASIATADRFCRRIDNSWKMKGNITHLKRVRRLGDSILSSWRRWPLAGAWGMDLTLPPHWRRQPRGAKSSNINAQPLFSIVYLPIWLAVFPPVLSISILSAVQLYLCRLRLCMSGCPAWGQAYSEKWVSIWIDEKRKIAVFIVRMVCTGLVAVMLAETT